MFRDSVNNTTTEAIIGLIRTLPKREQKIIVKTLNNPKPKKKLSRKEKNKQKELKGIAEGLREIMEAKRGGKQLMDLEDALNEL